MNGMNAEQVRAYVAKKWPAASKTPLSQAFSQVIAHDEVSRSIDLSRLESLPSVTLHIQLQQIRQAAAAHALDCIDACRASCVEFDQDTVSYNVQCHFPELEFDECDDIADAAISKSREAAMKFASGYISGCLMRGREYSQDTVSFALQCRLPSLSAEECDLIAAEVLEASQRGRCSGP